jgi:hypothetical protein
VAITPVILATREADIGRLEIKASTGKMLARPHLNHKSGCGGVHLSFQLQGKNNRRNMVQAQPRYKWETLFEK